MTFYEKLEEKPNYKTWLMLFLGYIEATNGGRLTPLILASGHGILDIIKLLILSGANIEAKNNNGWTPLIHASFYDKLEAVKLLLYYKADVNAKDKYGRTALDRTTNKKIKKLLKEYGAK